MFLNQLFRLISGIFEIGFAIVLVAVFIMGIAFLAKSYETIGLIMTLGAVWFAASAMKNRN